VRSEKEVRAEIARLETFVRNDRLAQYKKVAIWTRIDQLRWAVGDESPFDDEARK
jgi:hypothetical protein